MVPDPPNLLDQLLPDRHPQADFFICDIFDAAPKDDLGSMEHPMFSLATRPDRRILSYEHNDVRIEVIPSVKGLATIHDKDILIYCISQLMAALNAGRKVGRRLHLRAHDLLVATNRDTSGDAYRRLRLLLSLPAPTARFHGRFPRLAIVVSMTPSLELSTWPHNGGSESEDRGSRVILSGVQSHPLPRKPPPCPCFQGWMRAAGSP